MTLDVKYIELAENKKLGQTVEYFGRIVLLDRLIIQNYFEK